MTVTIGGEDKTQNIQWQGFRIKDNLYEEVDTCRFTTKEYKPDTSSEIVINHDGDKIFGGYITKVERQRRGSKLNEYKVYARDYTEKTNRRRPAESYENETIENIIADLQSKYLPNFTLANVSASTTLDSFLIDRIPLGEALNKLADKVNYNWYIDYDKGIHFFAQGDEQGPDVTETNGNLINQSLQVTEDVSQLKNRVFVEGGIQVTDYERTEYETGDGNNDTFDLASKFHSEPTVTLNGTTQDVGLDNLDNDEDHDVMWNYQEKYIRFTTTPSDGDSIEVSGQIELPVVVRVEDSVSITEHGVHEFKITDKKITSPDDAKKRAETELDAYASEITEASFRTRNSSFKSGQKITLDVENLNQEYIIQSVTRTAEGPDSLIYDIDLATTRTLGIIKFMQDLLSSSERQEDRNPNKVLRLFFRDSQEVQVTENIALEAERQDHQSVSINEVIERNPDVIWVYGPYFPTDDTDNKRPARYDRGIKYA